MKERKEIEQPVAAAFARFNEEFDASLRSETRLLQTAIDRILNATGKHVRPLLALLAAEACGGVKDSTVNSAIFLELLHTATLIHDDVIDETKQRRGVPSLNAIFDNRVSVLVGDYVLSTALTRSIQTGDLRIISIVSELGRNLSEGEIKQLETADESIIDETCYLQVIYKKTATLLSACAEIGAISSGASDEQIAICRRFGELLGYSFQIKDDIFDYFKEANIGKPTGNDIREGKVTLPLIFALRSGGGEADEFRRIIFQKEFSEISCIVLFAKKDYCLPVLCFVDAPVGQGTKVVCDKDGIAKDTCGALVAILERLNAGKQKDCHHGPLQGMFYPAKQCDKALHCLLYLNTVFRGRIVAAHDADFAVAYARGNRQPLNQQPVQLKYLGYACFPKVLGGFQDMLQGLFVVEQHLRLFDTFSERRNILLQKMLCLEHSVGVAFHARRFPGKFYHEPLKLP